MPLKNGATRNSSSEQGLLWKFGRNKEKDSCKMTSNSVEFVLRLRDLMSGGLGRLSTTSQNAFSRMAQHAEQMNRRNRVLGMSYDELQKRIKEVENTVRTSTIPRDIANARRELASLQRQSNNHAGNLGNAGSSSKGGLGIGGVAIGSMLGGLATTAGTAIMGAISSGIGGAISGSMKKQQQITGLTTFLGKDGAQDAYKNIQKDAEISPFDTDSLLSVNRALISAGLNAKDAREDSMNLANAISAVGGGNAELDRMAANMQQIKTVGKATAMDIKQFGMVGINIYEMLAKSTGKSIDQVKEMDVTYDQLAKAMAMARGKGGIYEGALEAQGATMEGKWSTMKDKFGTALTQIGDSFSPIINKVLDVGVRFAESVGPMLQQIQPYIDMISSGLGSAIDYVLSLTSSTGEWSDWIAIASDYYSNVWRFLKSIFTSVWGIVSGVIKWIAKSEIIKDAVRIIMFLFSGIFEVVGWIGDKLLWIWENVLQPILEGLDDVYKGIKDFLGLGSDDPIKVEATKKIVEEKEDTPSYTADLTRFGDKDSAISDGETKKKANKERSKSAGDTISGGGPKTINISLGKFFDTIQFTTMNGSESAEKLESVVLECLGRVLYNGAKVI